MKPLPDAARDPTQGAAEPLLTPPSHAGKLHSRARIAAFFVSPGTQCVTSIRGIRSSPPSTPKGGDDPRQHRTPHLDRRMAAAVGRTGTGHVEREHSALFNAAHGGGMRSLVLDGSSRASDTGYLRVIRPERGCRRRLHVMRGRVSRRVASRILGRLRPGLATRPRRIRIRLNSADSARGRRVTLSLGGMPTRPYDHASL